jgi:TATA-box binding protein (TBP) (component of TFIID and TFIIIB)
MQDIQSNYDQDLDRRLFEYKHNTCLDNSILTINSNVYIDMKRLNNLLGGQLSKSLSGVRYMTFINNQRYSINIFSSGKVNITNLFYISEMQHIYNYIISMFVFMLYTNVAYFKKFGKTNTAYYKYSGDYFDDSFEYIYSYTNRKKCVCNTREILELEFLLENLNFSLQINEYMFKKKYSTNTDFEREMSLINIFNYLINNLNSSNDVTYADYFSRPVVRFPADLIKIYLNRNFSKSLVQLKSKASRKRSKNNFSDQRISIHVFNNGKFIVTGGQTKEDLDNLINIFQILFEYFF